MSALAQPPIRTTKALSEDQFVSWWEQPAASLAALTHQREKVFVFPARESAFRFVVKTNQLPAWVEPTISAFSGIQSLHDNWDSYGGKKMSHDLIRLSLSILGQIMASSSPAPSVVPLGSGGIQLEWHRKQQDLEITFPADDIPQFFYRNRATGVEKEGFASDVANLTELMSNIA